MVLGRHCLHQEFRSGRRTRRSRRLRPKRSMRGAAASDIVYVIVSAIFMNRTLVHILPTWNLQLLTCSYLAKRFLLRRDTVILSQPLSLNAAHVAHAAAVVIVVAAARDLAGAASAGVAVAIVGQSPARGTTAAPRPTSWMGAPAPRCAAQSPARWPAEWTRWWAGRTAKRACSRCCCAGITTSCSPSHPPRGILKYQCPLFHCRFSSAIAANNPCTFSRALSSRSVPWCRQPAATRTASGGPNRTC